MLAKCINVLHHEICPVMHGAQFNINTREQDSPYLCSLRFGMGDSEPAPAPAPLVAGRLIDGIMGTDFPAV